MERERALAILDDHGRYAVWLAGTKTTRPAERLKYGEGVKDVLAAGAKHVVAPFTEGRRCKVEGMKSG
jgi:hypothetical protein